MSNINAKYKRQFYFSHDSISFESCWDPDINVASLSLGGDRSKQICCSMLCRVSWLLPSDLTGKLTQACQNMKPLIPQSSSTELFRRPGTCL